MGVEGIDRSSGNDRTAAAADASPMGLAEGWDTRARFDQGLAARVGALADASTVVERREAELNQQIEAGYHTAAGLTEAQYRDAARQHPDYAAQRAATEDLSGFLAGNLSEFGRAMEATHGALGPEAASIHQAGVEIARAAANGAASASVVSDLGTIAGHASTGLELGVEAGVIASRYASLAEHLGTSLGVASSVASLAGGIGDVRDGTANAGTYMEMAGETGALGAAALQALGLGVRGLGPAATALSVAGSMYSEVADRQRQQADVAATLARAGIAPAAASAISQAQPDTLRALAEAGVTPAHVNAIAVGNPAALAQHADLTRGLIAATGLQGGALAGLIVAAGPGTGALYNRATDMAHGYAPPRSLQDFVSRLENDPRGVSPALAPALAYLRSRG